jgi:DNA helicase II / ATP-dependent DNA helicase PcrA
VTVGVDLSALLGVPFTSEQLAAATAPLGPAVVVAGAGSGKTSVMAARVVWLVVSGQLLPEQVLGLTFTNRAAAELAGRVHKALLRAGAAGADAEPTVATYHAYAGRLLREHGLRIGIEPGARLLADATRFQLADRVLRRARGPFHALDKTVGALVGDLVQLDGDLAEHLVEVADLVAADDVILAEIDGVAAPTQAVRDAAAAARARSELASLVADLHREKTRLGTLDFGDQLVHAARLAREHPVVGEVERSRFRVVLLDEYQDTSHAQKRLLLDLFGNGHPVTAVGDPCQAIYGWRGASVANIDAFPQEFRTASAVPAPRYPLSQNNRSGGRLLDLANALSGPLRAEHPGVLELRPRPAAVGQGDTLCALLETYADEVAWVADQVCGLLAGGHAPSDVAVLVRARTDFPAYHDALVDRGVPVEVVGLGGLLALPEVADVVATLTVLDDPTANAALVRLLAGPRWRVGPRDLVLLGRRAADLVRGADRDLDGEDVPVERLLEEAVAGIDPVDVVSLADAVERPGGLPYSVEARERFVSLATELRELRGHLGEPLLDLLRRVLSQTGLEVEVAAAPQSARTRRGDALGSFLDHAAAFAELDGDPSVRAFLAFLRAADAFERGLDTAAPSPGDSVKLMTVHKAKGLEWPVVVLPDLTAGVFPAKLGRPLYTRSGCTLPPTLRGDGADLPLVRDWSTKGLTAYRGAVAELDRLEELRLAYVAVTRARDLLVASAHWWGPTQVGLRGPSPYLDTVRAHCEAGGGTVAAWVEQPTEDRNPFLRSRTRLEWPAPLQPAGLRARRQAAEWVRQAMREPPTLFDADLGSGDLRRVDDQPATAELADRLASWDRDIALLLEEERRSHRVELDVPLPASLSASALVRLASDPAGLARELARPLPRPPAPAARRGTHFHAWVEALFGEQPLLDRTELEGAADDDLEADQTLAELQEAFLAGPYAGRPPHRVEAPFQLVLAGRVVRGRIDAVYRDGVGDTTGGARYEVVDWKTGRSPADELQLAIYRLAWARVACVPEDQVGAAFYYVASGRVVRPDRLAGAAELEQLLTGD